MGGNGGCGSDRAAMVPAEEALQMVLTVAQRLAPITVPLHEALGKVLAEDIRAPDPLPPYPASVKDGYAVVASDGPGEYPVITESRAGNDGLGVTVAPGTVAYVTTGGPIPDGADAVVQVEETELVKDASAGPKRVRILVESRKGADIRPVGFDIEKDVIVLSSGERVGASEIGLLATVGVTMVKVYPTPTIAVLSTGDELVEPITKFLNRGQIRDSNRAMILAAAVEQHCQVLDLGIAPDDEEEIGKILQSAFSSGADIVLTSGGVSMGDKDFIKPLLERQGRVHFSKVCMKPGKPLTFAEIGPESAGHTTGKKIMAFGLPGNPVSSMVCFHLFVTPAIRHLSGWANPQLSRFLNLPSSTKQLPSKDVISNPKSSRSITDLPSALVSEILNYLDPKELGIVSCVSTVLHRIASEHHAWKDFYSDLWGLPVSVVPAALGSGISDEKSWKKMFVEREFRSKTFMGRFNSDLLYGHTEAVRTVFLLASAKLVFTAGYDSTVRMWDMEECRSIASSRSLGCTIRAVAADTKLLLAGGTDGFIQCWRAVDGFPHLFDLKGSQHQNCEFRLWEHEGPITSLALDYTKIYSGSWDMTVRVWDRTSLKCIKVLKHSDWVWALAPHHTTIATTSGSDVYLWDTDSGSLLTVINNAHSGNVYSLARSHTGDFLFTGGEDGAIHMFELVGSDEIDYLHIATWIPHLSPVNSLSFEFPWLVSASSDGKLALVGVRKLLRSSRCSLAKKLARAGKIDRSRVEPPQRMLHGFGSDLFSVDIGADRIVAGGEEGVVKVWNFSQALEAEKKARVLRGIRLENRMRRRKLQIEMSSKGGRADQCSVAAKNSINGDKNGIWCSKRGMSSKVKA